MSYFHILEEKQIMRHLLLVCCFLPVLLFCSCAKIAAKKSDKELLFQRYPELYHIREPDVIDQKADRLIADLLKFKSETELDFLLIHAYAAKAFAADLRNEKTDSEKYLHTALKLLPKIRNTLFYVKSASDVYYMFYWVNRENIDKAEYWLAELESLIRNEINSYNYKFGSSEYKRFVQSKFLENTVTRSEFLLVYKKNLPAAERVLLCGMKKACEWPDYPSFVSTLYSYDLASEIYYRKKDEAACCRYVEKWLLLAMKLNRLPTYSRFHFYNIQMKNGHYRPALDYCLKILDMDFLKSSEMNGIRKIFLERASEAAYKLKDFKTAEKYAAQAEKLSLPPENGNKSSSKLK